MSSLAVILAAKYRENGWLWMVCLGLKVGSWVIETEISWQKLRFVGTEHLFWQALNQTMDTVMFYLFSCKIVANTGKNRV